MSLRSKIFVLTTLLVAGSVLVAALLVQREVRESALSEAEFRLNTAIEGTAHLEAERHKAQLSQTRMLASDRRLGVALTQGDPAAVADRAEALFSNLPAENDLLAVIDREGRPLALHGVADGAVRLTPSAWKHLEPLDSVPATEASSRQGLSFLGDDVFELTLSSIPAGTEPQPAAGSLVLGRRIGDSLAQQILDFTGSSVVIFSGPRIVGSSLPEERVPDLVLQLPRLAEGTPQQVTLAGQPYLARRGVGGAYDGRGALNHVVLHSLQTANLLTERVRRTLVSVVLAAILLAFAAAWLGARRITRPLLQLAEGMSRMTFTGKMELPPSNGSGGHEVNLFQEAFRHMMDSIERSHEALERSYVEAVGAVMAAVDRRDHQSTGHSYRVACYAMALARQLRVDDAEMQAIEWGALLHDVGKIALPDSILRKNGPLNSDEWHIMRQHPSWGYEILADVQFLKPALAIVYNHHEQWDGSGYPRGLKGEAIPRPARIFAVVDAYDAITSDRHYRKARTHIEAVAELRRVAGAQVDPKAVEAFVGLGEMELRRLRSLTRSLDAGFKMPSALAELLVQGRHR